MNPPLIGVNLYCFRDFCQSEGELDRTLGRLRAIGFPSVQISGIGDVPTSAVERLLVKHGLVACAAHDNLEALTQRPAQVIAKLKALRCPFTALGYPGDANLKPENVPQLVESLVKAGRALAAEGLKLGYHNHAQEFLRYQGTSLLAWIYDNTPGDALYAELDTAWVQVGGGSPVAWIRRLAGRMPAVHLKDYRWLEGKPQLCEVGQGNLDWPEIFAALVDTGVPVWIVELDDPVPERDMFQSAELSLHFIQEFLHR